MECDILIFFLSDTCANVAKLYIPPTEIFWNGYHGEILKDSYGKTVAAKNTDFFLKKTMYI